MTSAAAGDVVDRMLDGLRRGVDLADLHRSIGDCFLSDRSLSSRSLLEVAADAFVACRVSPSDPLELDGLDRRLYPEWPARGNILIAVGVEPENASWWRHDDLWSHAFDAVIVFVRAAAERRAVNVAEICDELRANV